MGAAKINTKTTRTYRTPKTASMSTVEGKKWEEAQRRAFTHWVNTMLKRRDDRIDDVLTDFVSGVKLINLVEILTQVDLTARWAKNPKMKVHKINNCFMAINHLKEQGVQHLTVAAEDFWNNNKPMILGFCWQLLRTFQGLAGNSASGGKGTSFEAGLLDWVKNMLCDYSDINLDAGFRSEDFKNGKVILGLINEYDESFLNYSAYDKSDYYRNCKDAFEIAEEKMSIPAIIDYQDLASGNCGEKQLVLYLSLMYNAYKEKDLGMTRDSLAKRAQDLELKLSHLEEENAHLKLSLNQLNTSSVDLKEQLTLTTAESQTLGSHHTQLSSEFSELSSKYDEHKSQWEDELAKLKAKMAELSENSDATTSALQDEWHQINQSRDLLREEWKLTKEKLTKEREELEAEQKKLLQRLEREKKVTESLQKILDSQEDHHQKTIDVLRKHLLQHVRDMNVWEPILEEDREHQGNPLKLPDEGEVAKKSYEAQVKVLTDVTKDENKSLQMLLKERELEAAEVVSVNMGKLKKRIKKQTEIDSKKK